MENTPAALSPPPASCVTLSLSGLICKMGKVTEIDLETSEQYLAHSELSDVVSYCYCICIRCQQPPISVETPSGSLLC